MIALRHCKSVPLAVFVVLLWAFPGEGVCGPHPPATTTELAGNHLTAYPFFEYVRAFNDASPAPSIELAIDPYRFPEIRGTSCDAYIVEARNKTEWLQNTGLTDVRGAGYPQHVSFPAMGGIQQYTHALSGLSALQSDDVEPCFLDWVTFETRCIGLGHAYDLVLDCDEDGKLDTGDFIDGGAGEAGLYLVHDTVQSKLAVACVDYGASDLPSNIRRERTYAPRDLWDVSSQHPLPLVVISHGGGQRYDAYEYLQSHLASYGYVVMSLQNSAASSPAGPATVSTDILQHTDNLLDLINDPACADRVEAAAACDGEGQGLPDFSICDLAGAVDTNKIVWIGHSKGGDAIVWAFDRLGLDPSDPDYYPAQHFDQDDIALLSAMAPVDRPFLAHSDTKPFHLIWGAGDADVSGAPHVDSQENMSFQILDRAHGNKQSVYIHGGAHGWFHERCPLGNPVDCAVRGPGISVTEDDVHKIVKGYDVPLLKVYLEKNIAGQDFLSRPWSRFKPIGAPQLPIAEENRFEEGTTRFVIDDFSDQDLGSSSSGGSVKYELDDLFEGPMEDQDCHFDWERSSAVPGVPLNAPVCQELCVPPCPCPSGYGSPNAGSTVPCDFHGTSGCDFVPDQPMNGMTRSRAGSESYGGVFEWSQQGESYEWSLPKGLELPADTYLSFRAAQMPRHPRTLAASGDLDFKVVLRDRSDVTSGICLSAYGAGIIEPYGRTGPGLEESPAPGSIYDCMCVGNNVCCAPGSCNPTLSDPGWQAEFETVRLRLADFKNEGSSLSLKELSGVKFEFGTCGTSAEGRIAVDDVEFTSPGVIVPPPPPCPAVAPCNGSSCLQGTEVADADTTLHLCQPQAGAPLDCGAATVHIITNHCNKAACCTQHPPCFCQTGPCADGTRLECR